MEPMLETIQLGMPFMGNGRAPVGKVGVVRTSQPVIKTPSPSFNIPKAGPTGSVIFRPNTRVLTAQEEKQAQRRANQLQRQADRQARREARRNRPSYFERHGETRFDTFVNASGQVLDIAGNIAGIVQAFKGGNEVYIQDVSGERRLMTGEDVQWIEEQAMQHGGNLDMATLKNIIEANQKKDNTALYVGLGVGALVLVALVMMMNKK